MITIWWFTSQLVFSLGLCLATLGDCSGGSGLETFGGETQRLYVPGATVRRRKKDGGFSHGDFTPKWLTKHGPMVIEESKMLISKILIGPKKMGLKTKFQGNLAYKRGQVVWSDMRSQVNAVHCSHPNIRMVWAENRVPPIPTDDHHFPHIPFEWPILINFGKVPSFGRSQNSSLSHSVRCATGRNKPWNYGECIVWGPGRTLGLNCVGVSTFEPCLE